MITQQFQFQIKHFISLETSTSIQWDHYSEAGAIKPCDMTEEEVSS